MIAVAQKSPRQLDIVRLLAASDAASAARYPLESRHGVSLDVLDQPGWRMFVARDDGAAIGCCALAPDGGNAAEVKRLFIDENARCRGVARLLLQALEDAARAAGARVLRLETGIHSHAALALYRRMGFVECGRFGAYPEDPLSVWMEKTL